MSERILDLLDQARKECFRLGSKPATTVGYDELEKFAKLIIEQCGIVGDNWVDNEDDGKNRISDKFKEHFGVK
jgi:hypothetical protein